MKRTFYFSVAVHGATVLSTLFVLWKEIAGLFKGFFAFRMNDDTRYVIKLFISMIPVGISGLFMSEIAEKFFAGNMISLGNRISYKCTFPWTYPDNQAQRKGNNTIWIPL